MGYRFFILALTFLFGITGLNAKGDLKSQDNGLLKKEIALMTSQTLSHGRVIKIKVDGLVCSFCAYGLETRVSELHFVETNSFGGDGVMVDLER